MAARTCKRDLDGIGSAPAPPEMPVRQLLDLLDERFMVSEQEVANTRETITPKPHRGLETEIVA